MIKKDRILGIDPGSQVAGFAFITTARELPVMPRDFIVEGAGAIRMDRSLSHTQRIGKLHEVVLQLIEEYRPTACVIEQGFLGLNASSALRLGETRGAIIASACKFGVEVVEVSPTHVKKTVAGNGRASKEEVALALQALLQFKLGSLPYDVSDALAVALTHGLAVAFQRRTVSPATLGR